MEVYLIGFGSITSTQEETCASFTAACWNNCESTSYEECRYDYTYWVYEDDDHDPYCESREGHQSDEDYPTKFEDQSCEGFYFQSVDSNCF